MAWDKIEGVSVYEIRAGVQKAVERAHEESKPTIIEIMTYRHKGHSVADANAEKYRTKEEIQKYMQEHDPIDTLRRTLLDRKVDEDTLKKVDREVKDLVTDAADFAQQSPEPDVSELWTDILVEA